MMMNNNNNTDSTSFSFPSSPIPNERKMYIHPYYEQSTFSTWSTIPTTNYLPLQETMYTQLYHYHPIITEEQQEYTPPTTPQPQKRTRGRRVSNIIPHLGSSRIFDCKSEGCGKVFKRSEHLKRHIRSIHTMEKPFKCPYTHCNKCFSRSDNLNQHIRIHRHKSSNTSSSPQLYPF